MATGRSNQLIKQLGEYLVACELARRGFVVATFSGNIPDFDLIATDFKGVSYPIQVKTVRGVFVKRKGTHLMIEKERSL